LRRGEEEHDVLDERTQDVVDWSTFASVRAELGANFVRILGYFREDGEKSVAKIEAAMHAKDAAAMILPAHTMKSEARQFGALPLAMLAEEIESSARHGIEIRLFPDEILPQVAQLRPLYRQTMALLEERANPLIQRRPGFGRRAGQAA
jgi:HPt (histidine-containing phosphotransfer) domain-containing protein